MPPVRAWRGATGKSLSSESAAPPPVARRRSDARSCCSKWVTAGAALVRERQRKSPTGVRTKARFERAPRVKVPSGSFNRCRRGEFPSSQEPGPGGDAPGDRVKKSAAMKSSTMRGPKGLAGECFRRRSQTARRVSLEGNGELLAPAPRNRPHDVGRSETAATREGARRAR